MKDMPANQLDPQVKNVWRINDAIWITVVMLCVALLAVPFGAAAEIGGGPGGSRLVFYSFNSMT